MRVPPPCLPACLPPARPAPQSQTAVYIGFVVFILGWIFQTVQTAAQLPYSPNYYYR